MRIVHQIEQPDGIAVIETGQLWDGLHPGGIQVVPPACDVDTYKDMAYTSFFRDMGYLTFRIELCRYRASGTSAPIRTNN